MKEGQAENKEQMVDISPNTLNLNKPNTPIKRQRLSDWRKKKEVPTMCHLQETHFTKKKIYHMNNKQLESWCGHIKIR